MLLKLYDKNNNPQDLQRIIDILNDGGLIIYQMCIRDRSKVFLWLLLRALLQGILLPHSQIHTLGVHGS